MSTKADLDYETKRSYTVMVTATDPGGLSATATVTITVTGVDEAPEIMVGGLAISGMSRVDYAEDRRDDVATYRASGPDAASATWTLEGDDAGDFDISSSGVLTFRASPNHEAAADADTGNTYMVTVKANDGTYSDTHDVTVTVTNVDEAPVIAGDAALDYAENGTGPVATYSATDPEGATITWSLGGDDAADFEISADGVLTFKSSPDHEAAADDDTDNAYEVTVVASDGANEDRLDVTVTVTNVDEAPPVIAGDAALNYAENGTAAVATYSATDPESATTTWSLVGDDAAGFEISADGVLTFGSPPDYENPADADQDNVYEVTVVASDGTYSDTQDVAVTVTDVDEAPVITGDVAPNYAENGTAAVATYSATDPESATTTTWSLVGDDAAGFEISADGVLTFGSPPDYENTADADQDNVYEVTVVASDGTYSDTQDVAVTVTDVDEAPVITGDVAPNYAENGTAAVATYSATDPESATTTWSLVGDDAAGFEISADGVLTFGSPPDYENTADADQDNVYEVTVVASDGTYSDTQDVAVTVTDVDEAPVITGDVAPNYAENGTAAVATYSATDPESATTTTWSLVGDDAAGFEISADGVLTFGSPPDYENPADADQDNVYEVTVVASDGTYSDTQDVAVTVTDVDEAPVITGDVAPNYAENGTAAVATYSATDPESATTTTWSLGGDDAADFEISADGVLTFGSPPDYENPADADQDNVYEVTVKASDGTNEATLDVTVTVADVDEAPVITGDVAPNYAENGTAAVATYSATDPESATTTTWSLGGDDAADFEISADGVLTFGSPPDYENPADADQDNVYEVTVKASDGTNEATLDVTVTVADVDEAPVITGDVAPNYAENGTAAVATYSATDPESATTTTWSLGGDDAADFEISADGVLTFGSPPDYENPADADQDNVYEVTVKASDGTNEATLDVTITVTNVDEGFEVSGPAAMDYAENGTAAVATYSATDPESATTTTWSLGGDDAADFEISADGVLTFGSPPDYENPADADQDNVYEVTVKASDGTNEATLDVTVTVADVDEAPVITGDVAPNYAENGTAAVATYSATDPESATTTTWSLGGDDAALFDLSSGGVLTFGSPPDYENPADADQDNVYEVTVKASDGTNEATLDVTVTVADVDEAPVITGDVAPNYAENGTAAVATYSATDPESATTTTWSLGGDDAADFEISADGVLTFGSPPDYENPADADQDNVYEVTVKASDGTNEATLDVTITVTNVDEGFEVSGPAAMDYAENGTAAVATYSATDPESATTTTWSLGGDDAADFEISADGVLTFGSPPDYENPADADQDNVYEVTVKASDGTNEATLDVTVTVADVDEAPVITGDVAPNYAENGDGRGGHLLGDGP